MGFAKDVQLLGTRTAPIALTGARRISAFMWNVSLQDGLGNMLLDLFLQPLGSTTHIPTVTVAQDLVGNVAFMGGR